MIAFTSLLKQLLKLIFIGCGLWLLWNLLQLHRTTKLATVKRAVRKVLNHKVLAVFLTAVYLITYSMCSYVYNANQASAVIKLNYEEASKNQNPNKTRFNASQILSEEILQKVIDRGAYEDVTVDELAACLHLSSAFDNRGLGDVDSLKVATEYSIHCSADVVQYGIRPKELLSLLADVYYEYFLQHYAENDQILNIDLSDVESMDYMDVDDFLEMKASEMSNYIKNFGYEDSSFRTSSGETFASLGEKIDNFGNVELERYRSFVLQNGLSNDKVDYSTRMDYENRLLRVKYEKNMAAYNVRLEGIDLYDSQMARIVLVPTSDLGDEFYMSRTKIEVDNFANEADDYLKKATELRIQMEHKQYDNAQIQNSVANWNVYQQADAMIASLKQELESLAMQSKALSDAYLQEKRNGYLYIGLVESSLQSMLGLKKGLIYSVGFILMLGAGLALQDTRMQEKKEGETE